jgi:hypothetical protein
VRVAACGQSGPVRRLLLVVAVAALAGVAGAAPPASAKTFRIARFGVRVELPATWQARNPRVVAKNVPEVRFVAFDFPVRRRFGTNLNVIVQRLRPGVTLREWLGPTPARRLRLPAGVSLHASRLGVFKSQGRPLFTDQYAFVRHRRAYLFTYTSLASAAKRYRPVFAASARTIRFT